MITIRQHVVEGLDSPRHLGIGLRGSGALVCTYNANWEVDILHADMIKAHFPDFPIPPYLPLYAMKIVVNPARRITTALIQDVPWSWCTMEDT